MKIVSDITIFILIILFLYTGIDKYIDFNVFQEQLGDSPILSKVAVPISYAIPGFEILVSISLFLSKYRKFGLYSSGVLLALFTIYIGYLFLFAPELPCSCGGIISQLSWTEHLILNVVLLFLSLLAIKIEKRLSLISS